MTRYQQYYARGKEKAVQEAIDFSHHSFGFDDDENAIPWEDIPAWQDHFRRVARRFGLVREFEENAII